MKYSKPEIAVLGSAVRAIEGLKQDPDMPDGFRTQITAYELDEE